MATFEAIASTTLGSSTSTVTFSSIPSDYEHLQLRSFYRDTGGIGLGILRATFNGDTGSNYTFHRLYGDSATSTVAANGSISQSNIQLVLGPSSYGLINGAWGAVISDIVDYASTNKYTTVRSFGGYDANGGTNAYACLFSGLWLSTSAITSITLTPDNNNFDVGSVFALYGLRSS